MIQAVLSPEPFESRTRLLTIEEGATVCALLAHAVREGALDPGLLSRTEVYVDGARLDRAAALDVELSRGQIVNLVVEPLGGGGGGDKDIGQILLQVAVLVIASWVGGPAGPLAAMSQMVRMVASAAILTAGNMAVQALYAPDREGQSKANDRYALQSASNQYRPWGQMPLALGRQVIAPDLAVKSYTQTIGEDVWLYGILGVHYGAVAVSDVKIGDTAISSMGADEVKVAYHLAPGPRTWSIYPNAVDQADFSEELNENGTTALVRAAGDVGEKFEFDFVFPSGLWFNKTSNGKSLDEDLVVTVRYRPIDDQGNPTGTGAWTAAPFPAAKRYTGANLPAGSLYFRNKIKEPWRVTRELSLPLGRYEFEFKREAPDDGPEGGGVEQVMLTAIRAIRFTPPITDETLSVIEFAVKATALNQGTLAPITLTAEPICDVWDGDSWGDPEPTSNPAALARWLVTGPAAAKPLPSHQADVGLGHWYEICADRGWDAGLRIIEPRSQAEGLQLLGQRGRAALYWSGRALEASPFVGKLAPRQLFHGRNLRGHGFRIVYPEPLHALRVEFQNLEQDGEPDEVVVYAEGYGPPGPGLDPELQPAVRVETFRIEGQCTIARAWRDGVWEMTERRYRRRVDSWSAHIDHIACRLGDRVRLSWWSIRRGLGHARVRCRRWTGGLVGGIRLDQPVEMEAGKTYAIDVRRPDGLTLNLQVQTTPGRVRELTFAAPVAAAEAPAAGDALAFGESGKVSEDVELISIEPQDDFTARLTGVRYIGEQLDAQDQLPLPDDLTTGVTGARRARPPSPRLIALQADPAGVRLAFAVAPWSGSPITGFTARWRWTPPSPAAGDAQSAAWQRLPALGADARVLVTPPVRALPSEAGDAEAATLIDLELVTVAANGGASEPLVVSGVEVRQTPFPPVVEDVDGLTRVSPDGSTRGVLFVRAQALEAGAQTELLVEVRERDAEGPTGPWRPVVGTLPAASPEGDFQDVRAGQKYGVRTRWRQANGWMSDWTAEAEAEIPAGSNVATDVTPDSPVRVEINTLYEIYGDTASAAASAAAAAASVTAAAASELAAATSQAAAATAASNAVQAEANAVIAQGAAQTAASNAANSAMAAAGSATTAANSATTATSAATSASGHASNAATSATAAANSATSAGNSATAAAGSASTASTQATNAGNSAAAALASSVSAQSVANRLIPERVSTGADFSAAFNPGNPNGTWTDLAWGTVVTATGEGSVRQHAGNVDATTRGALPVVAGRRYRASARGRVLTNAASGTQQRNIWFRIFDANWAYLGIASATDVLSPWNEAQGWVTRSVEVAAADILASYPAAAWVRANTRWDSNNTGLTHQVSFVRLEDITSEAAAASSASAAATSASSAATSATNAGTSASSAQTSATNAATSAGQASTSATQASNSATTAGGHASTASTAATNAANSATSAGNSATAASGSASTAATHATNAGNSATAAAGSAVSAASSYDGARLTAANLIPATFDQDGTFWTAAETGAPLSGGSPSATYPAVAGVGKVYQRTGFQILASRGLIRAEPGKTIEIEVRARVTADSSITGGTTEQFVPLNLIRLAADYSLVDYVSALAVPGFALGKNPFRVADGWITFRGRYTIPASPTFAYLRTRTYIGYDPGGSGNATFQIAYIAVRDVTALASSEAQASAAATSASNAATSASNAGTSATAAQTSATNAATSAGNAATSATQASNSATTAAGHASSASTSATNAANSATSASNSATAASGSASSAATHATNAGNSATAAAASLVSAQSVANRLIPERVSTGADFSASQSPGDPNAAWTDLSWGTVLTVSGEGLVRQGAGSANATTRGALPVVAGRRYRAEARGRVTANAASGDQRRNIWFRVFDANWGYLGVASAADSVSPWTEAQGWVTRSVETTADDILAAYPTAAHVRANARWDSQNVGVTYQVAFVRLSDITSEAAAAASASAAAGSASSASTSASNAATSASAASGSATQAATSASSASTSATQASTSATNAAGSASSASTSAGAAATSAGNAASSATAAATSASSAATHATNAGNSASAASSSATAASSSYNAAFNAARAAFPYDFSQDDRFWTGSSSGDPAAGGAPSGASYPAVSGVGKVLEFAGGGFRHVFSRSPAALVPARTWDVEARCRIKPGAVSTTVAITIQTLNTDWSVNDDFAGSTPAGYVASKTAVEADGWFILRRRYTVPASPTAAYLRPRVYTGAVGGSYGDVQIAYIKTIDVTEAVAAETSAAAASVSQSAAASSATSAAGSAASASTSATVAAAVGTLALNGNPVFADYPTTPGYPTGWVAYGTGTVTREAGLVSPYAMRVAAGAGASAGAQFAPTGGLNTVLPGQYFVLEADITLVSGALTGAGLLLQVRNSANGTVESITLPFGSTPEPGQSSAPGTGSAGRTYRFRKLVQVTHADAVKAALYAMSHWSTFGSIAAANTIDFHRVAVRPATSEEVAAGVALPSLSATVTAHTESIADLEEARAEARFELVAAATGGRPARFAMVSTNHSASGIALDADQIWFGDNTWFDDATNTFVTDDGDGARTIQMGPFGSDDLILWQGADTVAPGSATIANSSRAIGSDGQAYVNGKRQQGVYYEEPVPAVPASVTSTWADILTFVVPSGPISNLDSFTASFSLGIQTTPANTRSNNGAVAPAGDWELVEQDGVGTTATERDIMVGTWSTSIVGAGPTAANVTDFDVNGSLGRWAHSGLFTFKWGAGGRFVLRMKTNGSANLLVPVVGLRLNVNKYS